MLTTATQPALSRRESLPQGLEAVTEIIPDTLGLARDLQRVRVSWPALDAPALPYAELAQELATHERVLAVVHKRETPGLSLKCYLRRTAFTSPL